ncbi:MAG: RNA polymerase sigma factor [Chloroflexi bacterium]|nr:MAG: RNA polymerase sigma factor [Chloroflexota bacterium]
MLTPLSERAERIVGPTQTPIKDDVLVKQAQQDISRFTELYQRYVTRVYRYAMGRVGNEADAQDITSQTFIAAMENIHKFRGNSQFSTWLLGIARHKVADLYRHRRPEQGLETAVTLPDTHDDKDEIVSQHLQIEQVSQKLHTLAPDRAEALSLRLFGGLEVAEIAQLMGKKESAVRMLVFRGLRDLQARLNPTEEVPS